MAGEERNIPAGSNYGTNGFRSRRKQQMNRGFFPTPRKTQPYCPCFRIMMKGISHISIGSSITNNYLSRICPGRSPSGGNTWMGKRRSQIGYTRYPFHECSHTQCSSPVVRATIRLRGRWQIFHSIGKTHSNYCPYTPILAAPELNFPDILFGKGFEIPAQQIPTSLLTPFGPRHATPASFP